MWTDLRSGGADLYAGRVTGDGQLASGWPADGAPVCLASGDQIQPTLLACADGRLLTCWTDGRDGSQDIYGMLLGAGGTPARGWTDGGRPICTAPGAQTSPMVAQTHPNAAIVVWQDHRCGNWDIYAQRIHLNRGGGVNDAAEAEATASHLSLGGAWPNPARGALRVAFTLLGPGPAKLELLDVAGRKILEREVGGMGAGSHVVGLSEGEKPAPGVYALRLRAGGRVLSKIVILTR